nr:basic proline-rich protein-like [Loxodonta africana]
MTCNTARKGPSRDPRPLPASYGTLPLPATAPRGPVYVQRSLPAGSRPLLSPAAAPRRPSPNPSPLPTGFGPLPLSRTATWGTRPRTKAPSRQLWNPTLTRYPNPHLACSPEVYLPKTPSPFLQAVGPSRCQPPQPGDPARWAPGSGRLPPPPATWRGPGSDPRSLLACSGSLMLVSDPSCRPPRHPGYSAPTPGPFSPAPDPSCHLPGLLGDPARTPGRLPLALDPFCRSPNKPGNQTRPLSPSLSSRPLLPPPVARRGPGTDPRPLPLRPGHERTRSGPQAPSRRLQNPTPGDPAQNPGVFPQDPVSYRCPPLHLEDPIRTPGPFPPALETSGSPDDPGGTLGPFPPQLRLRPGHGGPDPGPRPLPADSGTQPPLAIAPGIPILNPRPHLTSSGHLLPLPSASRGPGWDLWPCLTSSGPLLPLPSPLEGPGPDPRPLSAGSGPLRLHATVTSPKRSRYTTQEPSHQLWSPLYACHGTQGIRPELQAPSHGFRTASATASGTEGTRPKPQGPSCRLQSPGLFSLAPDPSYCPPRHPGYSTRTPGRRIQAPSATRPSSQGIQPGLQAPSHGFQTASASTSSPRGPSQDPRPLSAGSGPPPVDLAQTPTTACHDNQGIQSRRLLPPPTTPKGPGPDPRTLPAGSGPLPLAPDPSCHPPWHPVDLAQTQTPSYRLQTPAATCNVTRGSSRDISPLPACSGS